LPTRTRLARCGGMRKHGGSSVSCVSTFSPPLSTVTHTLSPTNFLVTRYENEIRSPVRNCEGRPVTVSRDLCSSCKNQLSHVQKPSCDALVIYNSKQTETHPESSNLQTITGACRRHKVCTCVVASHEMEAPSNCMSTSPRWRMPLAEPVGETFVKRMPWWLSCRHTWTWGITECISRSG
jgi:hypothetical protein